MAPARRVSYRGSSRAASATRARGAGTGAQIRWDRLSRVALGGVLCVLLYLYISGGISVFRAWRQAHADSAQVGALERENRELSAQHAALAGRSAVEAQARRLGMAHPGELQFVVSGLPGN
ncbi:MAG: septum formation initiator family protein [Solirubrobacterales bacterium]|nr:septum formation initiator family protein [Solirubrobacterales bacterium]